MPWTIHYIHHVVAFATAWESRVAVFIATSFYKVFINAGTPLVLTEPGSKEPSKHLPVQSQQKKHWKKVRNMFKVNN